jgi:pyruvate dehydrogenase E1 component alpha subunit
MALLWKLPVIFVCENNRYAMGTPTSRHSSNPEFYKRLDLMPGIRVDGNNVLQLKLSSSGVSNGLTRMKHHYVSN